MTDFFKVHTQMANGWVGVNGKVFGSVRPGNLDEDGFIEMVLCAYSVNGFGYSSYLSFSRRKLLLTAFRPMHKTPTFYCSDLVRLLIDSKASKYPWLRLPFKKG